MCDGTHSLIDFLLARQSFQQLSGRNPDCPSEKLGGNGPSHLVERLEKSISSAFSIPLNIPTPPPPLIQSLCNQQITAVFRRSSTGGGGTGIASTSHGFGFLLLFFRTRADLRTNEFRANQERYDARNGDITRARV